MCYNDTADLFVDGAKYYLENAILLFYFLGLTTGLKISFIIGEYVKSDCRLFVSIELVTLFIFI